mmetsp:Transcript_4950/g.4144  ORF Transcript_4950/g.4144 Transcript_4950/m.4144 type:complete len:180 (+) Transcript_4950:107-646(+)
MTIRLPSLKGPTKKFYIGPFIEHHNSLEYKSVSQSSVLNDSTNPQTNISKVNSTQNLMNKSKDSTNYSRTLNATKSFMSRLKTEVDPEVIHELPYKDTLLLREQHAKIKKLLELDPNRKKIELELSKQRRYSKSPQKIPHDLMDADVKKYLDYLFLSPHHKEFQDKMLEKNGYFKELQE